MSNSFNDPNIGAAFAAHARAQVELLASCADSPRQSLAILESAGVDLTDFTEGDAAAIYLALSWAARTDRPARSKVAIAKMALRLLGSIDLWEDEDYRPFIASSRWGPGPIAALLHRTSFDPELIRRKISDLRDVAREVLILTRFHRSEARRCVA